MWENVLPAGWAIRGYDLSTGETLWVTSGPNDDSPLISDRWVVYLDHANKDTDSIVPGFGLVAVNLDSERRVWLGYLYLPHNSAFPTAYFSIDGPWVVWNARADNEHPSLNLYNLDTGQATVVDIPSCTLGDITGDPVNLSASDHTVLFQGCFQPMGYNIETGQFFSVPIDGNEAQPSLIAGWQFAKGQLVWVSVVGDGLRGETRVYTAPIVGQ
ncbi:MAG: hypothetical protein IT318_01345 [Anaerolineales bacterium]|nr:hypothetical protein [Anaerolineales bacterium]